MLLTFVNDFKMLRFKRLFQRGSDLLCSAHYFTLRPLQS